MASVNSAGSIQADYMKVLIAQLQNQNPLEPLNNNEMASQLAQFSQLQQLESMSTSFAEILSTAERNYACSLIGREVTFFKETDVGDLVEMSGVVQRVFNDPDEGNLLILETAEGGYTLSLGSVISVGN
ncbi:MAG: flagellar hook assembly protein FlgD [Planctomycetota bacterium]